MIETYRRVSGGWQSTLDQELIAVAADRLPGPHNTGYQNAPGWDGTFSGGTFASHYPDHFIAESDTTYYFCDFQAGVWVGTPPWWHLGAIAARNVKFVGCRFQFSANVEGFGNIDAMQCALFGDNISFDYCSFQPSVENYPERLVGEEIPTDPTTYVEYGKAYQYAICGSGTAYTYVGKLTVDHCDFWGFGNGLDMGDSTVEKPHIVKNSWFHHGGDPFAENQNPLTQFHNDCWLVNERDYKGAQCLNNRMEIWGNTNCLAWQGWGDYSDSQVQGNVFGGDNETVTIGAFSLVGHHRVKFTDNKFCTRIGRSGGYGRPLRDWAAVDSGLPGGSLWRRNTYWIPEESQVSNYPGANWKNPADDGKFWWPYDYDGTTPHAEDWTG